MEKIENELQSIKSKGYEILKIDNVIVIFQKKKDNLEELLWRISLMPFEERSLEKLKKNLKPEEIANLENLIKDKVISLTKTGHITFSKQLYDKMKKISREKYLLNQNLEFEVLEPEEFELIQKRPDLHQFEIVRAYDSKIYMIKNNLLRVNQNKILKEIKNPKSVTEVSNKLGLPDKMVLIILIILAERGECIEESKNVFKAL